MVDPCRTEFFGRILTVTTSVALMIKVAKTGGKVPALAVNVAVIVSGTTGVVIANVAIGLPTVKTGWVNPTPAVSQVIVFIANPAIAGELRTIFPVAP